MRGQVVVGVKDMETVGPLAWAIRYARQCDLPLFVIHAWIGHINPELPDPPTKLLQAAQATLRDALLFVRDHNVSCDGALHDGFAGKGLVASSLGADVVVVGASQRSLTSRMSRGSTSVYCVLHSKCPVVAIPTVRTRTDVQA
jgi:nucleotide-binding universal stress UspA family protein